MMDGILLATPDYVLRGEGIGESFDDVAAAAEALRSGRSPLVVGALPFQPGHRVALSTPVRTHHSAGPLPIVHLPDLPIARVVAELPTPDEHVARVAALVAELGRGPLRKVVAARSVVIAAESAIDPELLMAHLVARQPGANGYAVDLATAGRPGEALVGCTPELLVRLRGRTVTLHPLAGTLPRESNPVRDEQQAEKLLASVKNREEHSHVIDWIRERLTPLCGELSMPDGPQLLATPDVWHLATPITGTLAADVTALELAALLHPTPAVAGSPTEAALNWLAEREEDRGFYGGAVGWCSASGDGDWLVAIRCAEIAADGRTARVYAGGGIVIGSDPVAELDETTAKLRTLLRPLRVAHR